MKLCTTYILLLFPLLCFSQGKPARIDLKKLYGHWINTSVHFKDSCFSFFDGNTVIRDTTDALAAFLPDTINNSNSYSQELELKNNGGFSVMEIELTLSGGFTVDTTTDEINSSGSGVVGISRHGKRKDGNKVTIAYLDDNYLILEMPIENIRYSFFFINKARKNWKCYGGGRFRYYNQQNNKN